MSCKDGEIAGIRDYGGQNGRNPGATNCSDNGVLKRELAEQTNAEVVFSGPRDMVRVSVRQPCCGIQPGSVDLFQDQEIGVGFKDSLPDPIDITQTRIHIQKHSPLRWSDVRRDGRCTKIQGQDYRQVYAGHAEEGDGGPTSPYCENNKDKQGKRYKVLHPEMGKEVEEP